MIYDPYAPPGSLLREKSPDPAFYVVSRKKFMLLFVLTGGAYFFFWSYLNWARYKRASDASVLPLVRGFFAYYFLFSLFGRINTRMLACNRDEGALGSFYWPIWGFC